MDTLTEDILMVTLTDHPQLPFETLNLTLTAMEKEKPIHTIILIPERTLHLLQALQLQPPVSTEMLQDQGEEQIQLVLFMDIQLRLELTWLEQLMIWDTIIILQLLLQEMVESRFKVVREID